MLALLRLMLTTTCLAMIAGCNDAPVSNFFEACAQPGRAFVDQWSCTRPQVLASRQAAPDLQRLYIATGDTAADRVRAGKMTDVDARQSVTEAGSGVRDEAIRRAADGQLEGQDTCYAFGKIMACR